MNVYSVEDQMKRYNLTKEQAEEKIKKIKSNIYSIEDQIKKFGLTNEEAKDKIEKIKDVNVFSIEWQIKKFNISEEEAIKKIENIKNKTKKVQENMSEFEFNSMIPSKKEHWLKKGYSEEESSLKASENIKIATNNCNKFINKIKTDTKEMIEFKKKNSATLEYYLEKGMSMEDATRARKKRQTTFSLKICIEKYGLYVGISIWKERQEKWLKSVDGKITNEMRDSVSFNHFLKKNNNDYNQAIKNLEEVYNKKYNTNTFGKASKSSMKIFFILIEECKKKNLKFYCGIESNREYLMFSHETMKIYFYDFVIVDLKLIFEFHGSFFHSKEPTDKINEIGVSIGDNYNKDQVKKKLAQDKGFTLIELFEEDGIEINIKKCIEEFNKKVT